MYNTPYQNQMNMQIPVQNNLALVKGYFRKKSVLAAGIFAAILAAVEFISIFFLTPAASNLLDNSILGGQNSDLNDYLRILQDTMNSGSYGSAIFSFLISGLFVAAFLIIYFKSKTQCRTQTRAQDLRFYRYSPSFSWYSSVLLPALRFSLSSSRL